MLKKLMPKELKHLSSMWEKFLDIKLQAEGLDTYSKKYELNLNFRELYVHIDFEEGVTEIINS